MASSASSYRFFTIQQQGSAVIARPVDLILQGTTLAEMIKLELMQIADVTHCDLLVVDFDRVKLVSSSVISSLLGVKRHLASTNGRLKLCGMSESLRYVFKSLNMDGTVFEIVADVSEALAGGGSSISYYDVCGVLSPPAEESA